MKKYTSIVTFVFVLTFSGFLPIAFANEDASDVQVLQSKISVLLIQIESLQETFLELTGQNSVFDVELHEIKDTIGTKLNQTASIGYVVNVINLLDSDPEFLSRSYNRIFWSNE